MPIYCPISAGSLRLAQPVSPAKLAIRNSAMASITADSTISPRTRRKAKRSAELNLRSGGTSVTTGSNGPSVTWKI